MTEHQSSRTLVKSAPELWAECSDAASLARHLGAFGEIRITKLEPETTVAWEGTAASGTVKLETSGWGTRVTLTLKEDQSAAPETAVVAPEPVGEPEPVVEPELVAEPAAVAAPEVVVAPEPVVEPELVEEPEPVAALDPVEEPAAVEPEPIAIDPEPAPRRGMFTRLRRFRRKPAAIVESATPQPEPEASEPKPVAPLDPGPPSAPVPEPVPVATAPPEPEPVAEAPPEPAAPPEPEPPRPTGEEALVAALDSLGMAHHRPYSRS